MSLRTTITATPEVDHTAVSRTDRGRAVIQCATDDTTVLLVFDDEHHLAEWLTTVARKFADARTEALS